MKSIDVVIPCYRYGHYLRECVRSVLGQDIPGLRVLVIDDASPDNSAAVGAALASEDTRVTFVGHPVNQGHIATFNEGIDWVAADLMLLLSADDYLLPGALRRAIDLMNGHPEAGFVFGNALVLTEDGRTHPTRADLGDLDSGDSVVMDGFDFIGLCERRGAANIVPTPTAVVRTELLKRLGGYRPELPHSGDLEVWLRLAAHSAVGFIGAEQAVYRRHATNMSLTYQQDDCLLDLGQRKAAFDLFLQECGPALKGHEHLGQALLRSLGRAAVGHASSAFNSNRLELSQRLSEFALTVHPSVGRSGAWLALACKRRLGFRLTSALMPALGGLRRAKLRLRG